MPDAERLRVLSVLVSDSGGGAEHAAVELLGGLRARGVDVHLLTNRLELVGGTNVPHESIDLGPKLRRRSLARSGAAAPLLRHRLRRALEAQSPFDVLLLHFKKEQLLAATLPASVTGTVAWMEWGPLPGQIRAGVPRRIYTRASRRAGAVLAESELTAQSLAAAGIDPARITVTGSWFAGDAPTFTRAGRARVREELGIGPDAFVVGCVSRLHASKPLPGAIAAVRALPDDAHLILTGTGEEEARLRSLAAPLGKRMHFVPAPDRMMDVLSAFDVQVYAPGPTEGASRAVILGQLAGLPLIATAAEGTRGLLTPDTGMVVEPANDPAALAAALLAYRADPARRRREGASARAAVEARLDRTDPVAVALAVLRATALKS